MAEADPSPSFDLEPAPHQQSPGSAALEAAGTGPGTYLVDITLEEPVSPEELVQIIKRLREEARIEQREAGSDVDDADACPDTYSCCWAPVGMAVMPGPIVDELAQSEDHFEVKLQYVIDWDPIALMIANDDEEPGLFAFCAAAMQTPLPLGLEAIRMAHEVQEITHAVEIPLLRYRRSVQGNDFVDVRRQLLERSLVSQRWKIACLARRIRALHDKTHPWIEAVDGMMRVFSQLWWRQGDTTTDVSGMRGTVSAFFMAQARLEYESKTLNALLDSVNARIAGDMERLPVASGEIDGGAE